MSPRKWLSLILSLSMLAFLGWLAFGNQAVEVAPPPESNAEAAQQLRAVAQPKEADAPRQEVPSPLVSKAAKYGTLRIAAWFGSGSTRRPATNFPVLVRQYYGVDSVYGLIERSTDGAGMILVPKIPVGPVVVLAGRRLGAFTRAKVVVDEIVDVDLEIKSYVTVAGTVEDEAGVPIAGATVDAVRIELAATPFPVATSDARGAFEVRGIPNIGAISARAPGYVAAKLRSINEYGEGETKLSIKIVLASRGGVVRGVVVGPQGAPITGARVRIGAERPQESFHRLKLADGSKGFKRAAIEDRTSTDGAFTIDGLPPGTHLVRVRSKACAPWIGECVVTAGHTAELRIQLDRAVTCKGVVVLGDGKPAASCRVWVDTKRTFFSSSTLTDRDGAFELTGIAPGEVRLRAAARDQSRSKHSQIAQPGEEIVWNPRLGGGIELRGRVITVSGKPMSQVKLRVLEDPKEKGGTLRIHMVDTDRKGAFTVSGVDAGPILFVTVMTGVRQPVMLARVDASAGECVVRVPDPGEPTARISGVVRSQDGAALTRATVFLEVSKNTKSTVRLNERDGQFAFQDLYRGRYDLRIQAPGYVSEHRTRELAEGEHWILDMVSLERSGWVEVPLTGVSDAMRSNLEIRLRSVDSPGTVSNLDTSYATARSLPVRPGRYRLEFGGGGVAARSIDVSVRPGQSSRVACPAQHGLACGLVVHLPSGSGREKNVELIIRGDLGVAVRRRMPGTTGLTRPFQCSLAPGRYTVQARLPDGRSAEVPWEVSDSGAPNRIELTIEDRVPR